MTLGINTNLASQTAQQSQSRIQAEVSGAIDRLSSGLRINSAKDDAAGIAIAARFTTQIRGTTQAVRNANDAISLTQTADGALAAINDDLQRVRELAVQSANSSLSPSDRASLQVEVGQLQAEIERVATQTSFNGNQLLDGSFTSKAFQVGANVGQTITVAPLASARTSSIGAYRGFTASNISFSGGPTPSNSYYPFAIIAGGTTISFGSLKADVKVLVDAINTGEAPGLTASASNTPVPPGVSSASSTASGTATYTLNGVAIGIAGLTGPGSLAANRAAAVTAINAHTSETGVIATDIGSGIAMDAADGRNVSATYTAGSFSGSSESDFGLFVFAGTFRSSAMNLNYSAPAGVTGTLALSYGGITLAPSFSIGALGTLSTIDISTVTGANIALSSVDEALAQVSSARASLGAAQNRFSSAIDNLQTSGANLAASRSRIQDADFARETATLARGEVLQRASNAMVAQANQMPSLVLALLRG